MEPIIGVTIVGGILYLIFGSDKKNRNSVENVEPKESLLPEREVTKLRRSLKAALKKEKDSLPKGTEKKETKTDPK